MESLSSVVFILVFVGSNDLDFWIEGVQFEHFEASTIRIINRILSVSRVIFTICKFFQTRKDYIYQIINYPFVWFRFLRVKKQQATRTVIRIGRVQNSRRDRNKISLSKKIIMIQTLHIHIVDSYFHK